MNGIYGIFKSILNFGVSAQKEYDKLIISV